MLTRFRTFRYTRPFWGGLWILIGGAWMAWLPLSPITDIVRAGLGAVGGVFLGLILIALGVLIWIKPDQHRLAGIAAVVLGLLSYPVTNLGGFVTGMMLAVLGGSMAFAWAIPKLTPEIA